MVRCVLCEKHGIQRPIAKFICSLFGLYTQYVGVVASLRYKIMRVTVQCKVIRLGLFCG